MMKNSIVLVSFLISIALCSCRPLHQVNNSVYIGKARNFGDIERTISIAELDSIIASQKRVYLSDYKTYNLFELKALKLIKNKIEKLNFKPSEFLIEKVDINSPSYNWIRSLDFFRSQDQHVCYRLTHVDGVVYHYNEEKRNLEAKKNAGPDGSYSIAIGISGNFSGYDGLYLYSQNAKKIRIFWSQ